jgi:hypothetical protein
MRLAGSAAFGPGCISYDGRRSLWDGPWSRAAKARRAFYREDYFFSHNFYNPSNTASEAVVSFTNHPGTQPPNVTVALFASECLNIDLHFGNSQEH